MRELERKEKNGHKHQKQHKFLITLKMSEREPGEIPVVEAWVVSQDNKYYPTYIPVEQLEQFVKEIQRAIDDGVNFNEMAFDIDIKDIWFSQYRNGQRNSGEGGANCGDICNN